MEYYRPKYESRQSEDGRIKNVLYCIKCDQDVAQYMEHCEDCDLCISDYDHHCVFFSKCIGGGNIKAFYGSISFLILNFVVVLVLIVLDVKSTINERKMRVKN